jgi:hypothetical protein
MRVRLPQPRRLSRRERGDRLLEGFALSLRKRAIRRIG